LGCERTVVLG